MVMCNPTRFRSDFKNPADLDSEMNGVLEIFIQEGRKGYREGMLIKNYVLFESGSRMPQYESAALLSQLRKVVDQRQLLKLRKCAGLNEDGFSEG